MNPSSLLRPRSLASAALAFLLLAALPAGAADKPAAAPEAAQPAATAGAIRIMAGLVTPLTDETGTTWLPAQGFADGDTMDRPDLKIANTNIPSVYRSERFGMTSFTKKLPNGNYTVKLHFAVTYEAIDGPGQCVFTFEVEGRSFKDFDLFKKAGGARKAYVETIPVTIKDGDLEITFTSQSENPTISAIEIIPAS